MPQFYIMRAAHLASTPRKLSVAAVAEAQGEGTLILAKREHGYDKTVECTIYGSGFGYDVKPGDYCSYTIDTGLGYRNRCSRLHIEKVLEINAEGLVTKVDGVEFNTPRSVNTLVIEKRHTWVMT
jgi:hypothetical protein